ncbi:hypothetical protein Y032_0054g2440 [Ancylostoma ceylanicum]|uniref:Uncharacterized protein n=1 Tax=Ancylostoma ceylanicum TaxID=53326 RepID=A0A016U7N6_9BILA|nr:hypothetical protein Y032_0054g2440 [Ancylostoma ceylanicum]
MAKESQKSLHEKTIAAGLPDPSGTIESVWAIAANIILKSLNDYRSKKKAAKAAVAQAKNAALDELYKKMDSSQAEKFVFRLAKARHRNSLDVTEDKIRKWQMTLADAELRLNLKKTEIMSSID